eukprot:IDg13285t1
MSPASPTAALTTVIRLHYHTLNRAAIWKRSRAKKTHGLRRSSTVHIAPHFGDISARRARSSAPPAMTTAPRHTGRDGAVRRRGDTVTDGVH